MLALYGPGFTPLSPYSRPRGATSPASVDLTPSGYSFVETSQPPVKNPPSIEPQVTPIPPEPMPPVPQVPGAGPVITITPPPSGPFDVFAAESFAWWKPVAIAAGIALFGGAILSIFSRRRRSE